MPCLVCVGYENVFLSDVCLDLSGGWIELVIVDVVSVDKVSFGFSELIEIEGLLGSEVVMNTLYVLVNDRWEVPVVELYNNILVAVEKLKCVGKLDNMVIVSLAFRTVEDGRPIVRLEVLLLLAVVE